MRGSYGSELRKRFYAELKALDAGFVEAKLPEGELAPGERAYVRERSNAVWHWLVLTPSPKDDSFWLDVGWSRLKRFPQVGRPSAEAPSAALPCEEYFCRASQLTGTRLHFGWDIDAFLRTSEAREILSTMPDAKQSEPSTRVLVSVKACIRQLKEFGLPFLERVA